jgi:hypothetical protein
VEYDRILGDALRLTWRYRFLWVFALLGGGSSSSCGSGGGPNFNYSARQSTGTGSDGIPDELRPFVNAMQNFPAFLAAHIGLILAVIGTLFAIGLVFFVLSFIARGAMISSVARIGLAEAADFRSGWRVGLSLGWRYFGLWLLMLVLGVGFFLVIGLVALALILFAQAGETAKTLAIAIGVLLGLAGFAGLLLFMIALSIVNAFGERAIAIDDLGPVAALGRGYTLLTQHLWPSALIWLISVAIAIAAGIALAVPALVIGAPLGAMVFGAYSASGLSGPTVAAGAVAATIWIAVMWVFGSIVGTYGSVYWTLSYLMLTGRYPSPPVIPETTPIT